MNKENKTYFEKAGAVIVRERSSIQEVLLEYRERDYLKDWTFPKGGVEPGETPEETAKREILEETGLEIELIKSLPEILYHNSHDGDVRVKMFLAKPLTNTLHAELTHDKVEWVPFEQVSGRLSYPNLKEYFENIKNDLKIKETAHGKN